VWQIEDPLGPGKSGTIVIWVDVDTPLPNGTLLVNTVTIDSNETDPTSFITTTEISSAPAITYTITDQPDPVEAGDPLIYTLLYTNTGNADATNVVVTGTFDSFAPFSNATPAPAGGAGDVWYWELGTIAGMDNDGNVGSEEIVIQADVTLPLTNGTTLSFTMQLEDAEGDYLEDTVTTAVTSAPELSLDKSDGVSTVYAGDTLTYTITYANSGNENAYDVTITDTLPANYVQYVDCEITDGTCQHLPAEGKVVFQLPVIAAPTGGQAQLVIQVDDPLPAGADLVTNAARMTAPCLSAPIDVEDVDQIGTLPDLNVSVIHKPNLFSPGGLMNYVVTYGNAGWMDAEDVVIVTTLPSNTTYVGRDWSSSDGQTYTYAVEDLPAGDTGHTITFTVRYADQEQIDEAEFDTSFAIAETTYGGDDANPDDNTAEVYIGVPDLAVLHFIVSPWPLEPNVPVTFTIVLENQGTGWACNPETPGCGGGSWVDVFISPVPSYPFTGYSEKHIYDGLPALAPGAEYTLVITRTGPLEPDRQRIQFSEQEIQDEIKAFYVKVDNAGQHPYGLMPERDEMNNLGGPIAPDDPYYYIYLPLALRNQ
jgi:uncharacterized repeat protein (TIGR01451 family)